MRIFFAGNYQKEGGPWNVNRDIIAHLNGKASYTKYLSKFPRLLEILWKILNSQIIIFSGVSSIDHITVRFAKLLGRKIIYIMHGCARLENKANKRTDDLRGEQNELIDLALADRILCVSPLYRDVIKTEFPEYKDKMGVLINGVDWKKLSYDLENNTRPTSPRVALMGGGRVTKRNLQVCKAIDRLNVENRMQIEVEVFGSHSNSDDTQAIKSCQCVKNYSEIPHNELLLRLQGHSLFIQNSDLESFSLGVIEALSCGCSVLMSRNVGAQCIIPGLTDHDLIDDPLNIDELVRKIAYVLQHSNNSRLYHSIDKENTSIEASVTRLIQEAETLINA